MHWHIANHVAKAEDQAAANQRGQQREENFGEVGDKPLMPFHVLARGEFCLLFTGGAVTAGGDQRLVVITDIGANHHLKLSGVGKAAFHHWQLFYRFRIGFRRLIQYKTQTGNAVANGCDILAAAHKGYQLIDILLVYFAHDEALSQR